MVFGLGPSWTTGKHRISYFVIAVYANDINLICNGYELDMCWTQFPWKRWIISKYQWKRWMIKSGFRGKTEYSQRNSSSHNIMICNAYEFDLKWIWILSEMHVNFECICYGINEIDGWLGLDLDWQHKSTEHVILV